MSQRTSGRNEQFWLWTGETEYEGLLLSVDGGRLTARVRPSERCSPENGASGSPVPLDVRERQRRLFRRVGFGQSPAILSGALLEFRIETLQPSQDARFDYVLAGTFSGVADEHLEALSQLNSREVFHFLESTSRTRSPSRLETG
jgi:hypothetical protein